MRKGFSIAGRVAYSANIFLKIKSFFKHDVIPEKPSFSMRPAKYFYDKPLPKYLDPKIFTFLKFAAGIVDTGGIFAAGINNTSETGGTICRLCR